MEVRRCIEDEGRPLAAERQGVGFKLPQVVTVKSRGGERGGKGDGGTVIAVCRRH